MTQRYLDEYLLFLSNTYFWIRISTQQPYMLINLSARMLQCTENLTFYLSTAQTAHRFRTTSKATFKMGIGTNQKS